MNISAVANELIKGQHKIIIIIPMLDGSRALYLGPYIPGVSMRLVRSFSVSAVLII